MSLYLGDKKISGIGQDRIADTLPIGAIIEWDSDIIPENWLLLDGSAISRTVYSELFALYGTKYGEGDGSTTFNLPDRRTRVSVGKDLNDEDFSMLGLTGGEKEHTLTVDEMPKHNHELGYHTSLLIAKGADYGNPGNGTTYGQDWYTTESGGSQPHNNLQPYIVTNFIVKAKLYTTEFIEGVIIDNLDSNSSKDALSARMGKELHEEIRPIKTGGTGADNAEQARTNLNVYSKEEVYTKGAVYTKGEVYKKEEVYSKGETYTKNEVNWMRKFHVGEDMYLDLMNIDFTNPYSEVNRESYIGTEDASTLINCPVASGSFYAYRQVFCVPLKSGGFEGKYITLVKITEHYPIHGRIWTNMFNPVEYRWYGWKCSNNKNLMWSGSWSSGGCYVPYTDNYSAFLIDFIGYDTPIIAFRWADKIRGMGGYPADSSLETYHFSATIAGDIWNLIKANRINHNPSSNHSAFTDLAVENIYGLF